MTDSAPEDDHLAYPPGLSVLAEARLLLGVPEALTDRRVIPSYGHDDDPAVLAAIAAVRPIRTPAVLVYVSARAEPTVLLTQRTAHLAEHARKIGFPGGKVALGH